MFIVLSPAKRIDERSKIISEYTFARNPAKTQELIRNLKGFGPQELQDLMHINPKLADQNVDRFQKFKSRHNIKNSLQAFFAFNGDVFLGLDAKTLKENEVLFAQDHVRILSGLYGVLRPLDLIQAYRLEMGTKLQNDAGGNLYKFWGSMITNLIKKDMKAIGSDLLFNLASNEYYKAIDTRKIKKRIISATFREFKNGELKFYPVFGKKARGMMTRYVVENQISDPEDIKGFNMENYYFEEKYSNEEEYVFVR